MSEMTEKQAEEIVRQFTEGKSNNFTFFTNVVESDDTTKTGNLSQEELGFPKLPVRTYKELELFCKEIANDQGWADYFKKMSEIQTSTSLSKEALLLRLVNTIKKELADVTPKRKSNRGWFKRKNKGDEESQ